MFLRGYSVLRNETQARSRWFETSVQPIQRRSHAGIKGAAGVDTA